MAGKWMRTISIGLVIGLVTMALRGGFSPAGTEELLVALCDALFVSGALLTGVGLLIWVSGEGAFNAISYGTRKVIDQMRREENRNKTAKTYYDYVTEKQEKPRAFPKRVLGTGAGFLAAAGVVLLVYLRMYP